MGSLYAHHIRTTHLQKILLGGGSAIAALVDPYRDGNLIFIICYLSPNTVYVYG